MVNVTVPFRLHILTIHYNLTCKLLMTRGALLIFGHRVKVNFGAVCTIQNTLFCSITDVNHVLLRKSDNFTNTMILPFINYIEQVREKEGDLNQSYDKTPYTNRKFYNPKDNTQTPPQNSITQRLRTDLGRSVGVTSDQTGVVKPVYGYQTFPLTAKAV